MKRLLIPVILIALSLTKAQENTMTTSLYENYGSYKEESFQKRRFKHADMVPLIEKLKKDKKYSVEKAGKSIEGRDIYMIKIGTGKTKVLLWSQMHGDESTATMALFDIFNFLNSKGEFDSWRNKILNDLTLYIIPMLNPDGAERFQRRNALEVDLNRDAAALQCPESRILKAAVDTLKPEFGFNLHDQGRNYAAGLTPKWAALSFLAPAFNYEKDVNDVRLRAMKVIAAMNEKVSLFAEGHIGRYSDDFEPRAFGDNVQKWGTSAILIESGWWKDDPEKQQIRKLNFIAILSALYNIADGSYASRSQAEYETIPFNEKVMADVIIRNISLSINGTAIKSDIAISGDEITDDKNFYTKNAIIDSGDLSGMFGFEERDFTGLKAEPGKIYPETLSSPAKLNELDPGRLLAEGYLFARVDSLDSLSERGDYPLNIVSKDFKSAEIKNGGGANFILKQDGKIKYAVVNGFIYEIGSDVGAIKNTLIYR
jgi:hypothetical protein